MKKEDIRQLASLSRIEVTDNEVDSFQSEISSILEYVGQIQAMTGAVNDTKVPGAVFNKMRLDEVTNNPGAYTEAILGEFPRREGDFMKVKKIINVDE